MVEINIYGKNDDLKTKKARAIVRFVLAKQGIAHGVDVNYFDLEDTDGRAKGALRDVYQVPTTIIEDNGRQLMRNDGGVPFEDEIKKV